MKLISEEVMEMFLSKFKTVSSIIIINIVFCGLISGCGSAAVSGNSSTGSDLLGNLDGGASAEVHTSDEDFRDSTPRVLVPTADGTITYGDDRAIVDVSNVQDGYVMVDYKGDNDKPKLQIDGPQGTTYYYDLQGGLECFPLTEESGTYTFTVYEHVSEGNYSPLFSQPVDITINNEFLTYLYPNQYVNFNADTRAVAVAQELSDGCYTDLDVVSVVYNYVIANISYDYDMAQNVTSDYLPDVDEILDTGKGICFDYAALMTCMLRSQNIPTRLEVGYAGEAYHAWISTYVDDIGWVNGIIQFDGHSWSIMDPTLASTQGDEKIKDFVGDGSNYIVKYIY